MDSLAYPQFSGDAHPSSVGRVPVAAATSASGGVGGGSVSGGDSLAYLKEKDAFNVLSTEPLGNYLHAIVSTLKAFELRFAEGEAATDARLASVEQAQNAVPGLLDTLRVGLEELQGVGMGPAYRGDARLRAIEADLRRPPPGHRQSHPVAVTLDVSPKVYDARGGPAAFRASLAQRVGLSPEDVQVLSAPDAASPATGQAQVFFRLNYAQARAGAPAAEETAQALCDAMQPGGSVDRVMNTGVVGAARPDPRMLPEGSAARAGVLRHTVGSSVPALLGAVCEAKAQACRLEFLALHARRYFGRLQRYKRHRWKGNEERCRQLLAGCRNVLRALYYRKLRRHAEEAARRKRIQRGRERASRYLLASTTNGLRRVFYRKLKDYVKKRHQGKVCCHPPQLPSFLPPPPPPTHPTTTTHRNSCQAFS